MWTTFNFRGRGKTKKTARDIYLRTLDIEFEWDRSIGLGSTIGDGRTDGRTDRQTDRQTHTHTHTHTQTHTHTHFFLKHIFRLWEWCRIKNNTKKSKSNFLTIAILPSLLMSLESKTRRPLKVLKSCFCNRFSICLNPNIKINSLTFV